MDYYIEHHGMKGQKWGVRRFQNEDGTLTQAGKDRYSKEQYDRDKKVYGRIAANRVYKKVVNKGESVSGARSDEARRIARSRKAATMLRPVGTAVGTAGGVVAGRILGKKIINKHIDNSALEPFITSGTAAVGAALGGAFGRYALSSIPMIGGGYSSGKYRPEY